MVERHRPTLVRSPLLGSLDPRPLPLAYEPDLHLCDNWGSCLHWPTLDPKRLAEKMVLASQDLDERVS